MLLSETWLTPFSPELSIPGYSFLQKCRQNKKGGGVGILVSQHLKYKPRPELSSNMAENECITIDRDSVPKATWVFAIYEKWVLVKFMKPLGSLFV